MGREHVIDPSIIHHQWDAGLAPALEIDSGDVVHYDIKVAGQGQVWPGARYEDTRFDFDTIYNLSGPVWVKDAEPGDTLRGQITNGGRRVDYGFSPIHLCEVLVCRRGRGSRIDGLRSRVSPARG